MVNVAAGLDAHQKPPEQMRALFKRYQKSCNNDSTIIDLERLSEHLLVSMQRCGVIPSADRLRAFEYLSGEGISKSNKQHDVVNEDDALIYEVRALPGLLIIPSLLSPALQTELLNKLLHRDLVEPLHRTNLHLHYHMKHDKLGPTSNGAHSVTQQQERPSQHESQAGKPRDGQVPTATSMFSADSSATLRPKDPSIHDELSMKRVLEKKLRWVTLGAQYDWTSKEYPQERPPAFPSDIAGVLGALFPYVNPDAAILNIYSPGDTLSVHRDVSEKCDQALISVSLGCEAIFLAGNRDASQTATIRLRSGDVLVMSGPSRYAWHAVPKIIPGTCPDWLRDWPMLGSRGSTYAQWKGWMAGKRVNLNVRQIREPPENSE